MASPSVISVTESSVTAVDADPWTISRPAGIAGLKTLVFLAGDTGSGADAPAGYTKFSDGLDAGLRYKAFYHEETGAEGTTVDFTGGPTVKWTAIVFQIAGADLGGPAVINGDVNAPSNTPNPANLIPTDTSKSYLGITGFIQDGAYTDDDTWVTAKPTGWTNLATKTTGTLDAASTNSAMAWSWIGFAGTFTVDNFTTSQSLAHITDSMAFMEAMPPTYWSNQSGVRW